MSDPTESQQPKRGEFAQAKGEVILREHEYDGIQEFDQKLPNWWLFTFYFAIAWFVIYWVLYYHTGTYRTDQQKITSHLVQIEEQKSEALAATLSQLDDQTLINEWATNPEKTAAGEAIFSTNCVACHAADLSATMSVGEQKIPLPGLPLNDGQWKYGAKPLEVFNLINDGTPADSAGHNGARMQAWGQILTPEQIAEVTAFIISKNPKDFGL
ncbi:cytochrome c oxidase cbb3-type subunit 3 [Haloferula luteola]|uniref:Cytochrome c oxidase cbb3-type subunit 3 n=1 Tax=Haloferula luteola TaxID=595692 RepID=A0A840V2E5_9BACT|nr:cbb3-type cytochrome c oxidase N-terminal domain-containing protein [Haloferula luteola]MBB5351633.1 cytochrome c oxidase cbb3-type subunit 3 [Haloferula luteola]